MGSLTESSPKIEKDHYEIDEHFASIDGYSKTSNVYLWSTSFVELYPASGAGNYARISLNASDNAEDQAHGSLNPYLLIRCRVPFASDLIAYIGAIEPDVPVGVGFKFVNSSVYSVYFNNDSEEVLKLIEDINITKNNSYAVEYHGDGSAKWFINGNEVDSVSSGVNIGNSTMFYAKIQNTTATRKNLWIEQFHFEADFSDW